MKKMVCGRGLGQIALRFVLLLVIEVMVLLVFCSRFVFAGGGSVISGSADTGFTSYGHGTGNALDGTYSWIYYTAVGDSNEEIRFSPDGASDKEPQWEGHKNMISGECHENGGFWHFGADAHGTFTEENSYYPSGKATFHGFGYTIFTAAMDNLGNMRWYGDSKVLWKGYTAADFDSYYSTTTDGHGHIWSYDYDSKYALYDASGSSDYLLNHDLYKYIEGSGIVKFYSATTYSKSSSSNPAENAFLAYKQAYRYYYGRDYSGDDFPSPGPWYFCWWPGMAGTYYGQSGATQDKTGANDMREAHTGIVEAGSEVLQEELSMNPVRVKQGEEATITFKHDVFASEDTTDTEVAYRIDRLVPKYPGLSNGVTSGFSDSRGSFEVVSTSNGASLVQNTKSSVSLNGDYSENGKNYKTTKNKETGGNFIVETFNVKFNQPGEYTLCERLAVKDDADNKDKFTSGVCTYVVVSEAKYAGQSEVKFGDMGEDSWSGSGFATQDDAGLPKQNEPKPEKKVSVGDSFEVDFSHEAFADAQVSNVPRTVLRTIKIGNDEYCMSGTEEKDAGGKRLCNENSDIYKSYLEKVGNAGVGLYSDNSGTGSAPREDGWWRLLKEGSPAINNSVSFKVKQAANYEFCETLIVAGTTLTKACAQVRADNVRYAGESGVEIAGWEKLEPLFVTTDSSDRPIGDSRVAHGRAEIGDEKNGLNITFMHNGFVEKSAQNVGWNLSRTLEVIKDGNVIATNVGTNNNINNDPSYCPGDGKVGPLKKNCYFWLRGVDENGKPTTPGEGLADKSLNGIANTISDIKTDNNGKAWYYLGKKNYLREDKYNFVFYDIGVYKICEVLSVSGNQLTKTCAEITVGDVQKYAGLSMVTVKENPDLTTPWSELINPAEKAWGESTDVVEPDYACGATEAQENSACKRSAMALDPGKAVPIGFAHDGFSNKYDVKDIWRSVKKEVKIEIEESATVGAYISDWKSLEYAEMNFGSYMEFVAGESTSRSNYGKNDGSVSKDSEATYEDGKGQIWYYVLPRSDYGGGNHYFLADLFNVKFKAAGKYTFCETLEVGNKDKKLTRVCAEIKVGKPEYGAMSNVSFVNENNNYFAMSGVASESSVKNNNKLGGNWEDPLSNKNEYSVEDANKNSATIAFSHNGFVNMEVESAYQKMERTVSVSVDGKSLGECKGSGSGEQAGLNCSKFVDEYYTIEGGDFGLFTLASSVYNRDGKTSKFGDWYYLYPRYYENGGQWYSARDEYKITFKKAGVYTFCETLSVGSSVESNTELTRVCAKVTVGAAEYAAMGKVDVTAMKKQMRLNSASGRYELQIVRKYDCGAATDEPVSEMTTLLADECEKHWVGDAVEIDFVHDTFSKAVVPYDNQVGRSVTKTVKIGNGPEMPLNSMLGRTDIGLDMINGESGDFSDTGYTYMKKFNDTEWLYLMPRNYYTNEGQYMTGDVIYAVFWRAGIYTFCETSAVNGGELLKICARVEVGNNQVYYGKSAVAVDGDIRDTWIVRDGVKEESISKEAVVGDAFNMQFYHDAFTEQYVSKDDRNGFYNVVAERTVQITDDSGNTKTYSYGGGDGYVLNGGGSSDEVRMSRHYAASNGEQLDGKYKGFSVNPLNVLGSGQKINGERHFYGGNFALTFSKPGTYTFCEKLSVYGMGEDRNHLTTVCAEFTVTEPVVQDENCATWANETKYNLSGIPSGTEPSSVEGFSDVKTKIINYDLKGGNYMGWQDKTTYAKPGDYVEWLHCYYPGAQKLAKEKITIWTDVYDGHHEHSEDDTPGGNNPNTNVYFRNKGKWKNSVSIYVDADSDSGNRGVVNDSNFVKVKTGNPYFNSDNDKKGKLAVGFSSIVSYYDYFGNRLEKRDEEKQPGDAYRDELRIQPQFATSHKFVETIKTDEGVPTHTGISNEGEHPAWDCHFYDCGNCSCGTDPDPGNCSCGERSCNDSCWHGNDTIIVTDFDTTQKEDDASVIVPYNFENTVSFKLKGKTYNDDEIVYAGEDAEVQDVEIVVGKRENKEATGYTYATRVDEARVRMLAFVVDYSTFSGYDSWETRGLKSAGDDECDLIDNEKQCAVLGKYDGSLNEEEKDLNGKTYKNETIGTVGSGTYNIFDASAGDYYCVTMAIYPYTVANDFDTDPAGSRNWYIAKPQCRIIAKRPSFQVWGGSIYSAGGIVGSNYSDKVGLWNGIFYSGNSSSAYYGGLDYEASGRNHPTLYGSWVEQSVVAKSGTITWLPSGAAIGYNGEITTAREMSGTKYDGRDWLSGATTRYCEAWVPLSIANSNCPPGNAEIEPKSTRNGYSDAITALVRYWLEGHCDTNINTNCDYSTPTGKRVYYNKEYTGDYDGLSNKTWDNIDKNTTIVIAKQGGTVRIDKDIKYAADSYNSAVQVPKVIIYAHDIAIDCGVTQIDAILIADGMVNTCHDSGNIESSPDMNAEKRSVQLTINGAIIANKVLLNRTYGNAVGQYSDEPAEVINYDTSLLLWGHSAANASQSDTLTTVYQRELSPRY